MNAEIGKLPQARQDELFVEQMDEGLLVYDAKHFCAHRLNPTASWVWRHCDGQKTVAETTQLLADELQQPLDEELVWLSLESLDKARLLSTPVRRPSGADDDSRRAMIQKMAMAGGLMFLLPMITPLTKVARADAAINVTVADGTAITATGKKGAGIWAVSEGFEAVHAEGKSPNFGGVSGFVTHPQGTGAAIYGDNQGKGNGGQFQARSGAGVWAFSADFEGVHAETKSPKFGAVSGFVTNPNGTGAAIYGDNQGKGPAGYFRGNVEVTGDIRLLNADCAEDFDIADENIDAGTVMVLCDEGALQQSQAAYDKRVAGVISGAGDYKPGLVLDKKPTGRPRQPVALMGKVFCKADARYGAIEAGDLLTTSDTPGHAMKAADPAQAFGAVVGKALRGLTEGQGLIPILVSLQ
jgi:hypothetical protein